MKTINLTEKQVEYLRYILNSGFVVCDTQSEKEYKKETKLLKSLIKKIN